LIETATFVSLFCHPTGLRVRWQENKKKKIFDQKQKQKLKSGGKRMCVAMDSGQSSTARDRGPSSQWLSWPC